MTPLAQKVLLDLGVGDLHTPASVGEAKEPKTMATISTQTRNDLPASKFALPEERKYPIHDKSHVQNAAARLEQEKKAGKISDKDYGRAKRAIARAAKRFGIESEFNASDEGPKKKKTLHIRADLAHGGSLHVRHMSDSEEWTVYGHESLLLDEKQRGQDKVWIQIATMGRWLGHPKGPFQLTSQTFSEIIHNFKTTRNQRIPIDFEHVTEMDPRAGTVPVVGAPAQGWITDIKIENDNLYGLAEWLEPARTYIREGKYTDVSPAIELGSKDKVTGQKTGARLTSLALTNQPFLDGMQRIAASDKPFKELTHKPHEYMGSIKSALSMHPLSSARECMDHLEKLRDHVEMCGDAYGMHEGMNLGDYTRPLLDLVGGAPGTTWDEVFDVVEDLIHAAIEEHVIEDHGGAASMTYGDTPGEMTTMADEATTVALRDAKSEVSTLTLQLKDVTAKFTEAETELKTLREWKTAREDADLKNEVEVAWATYKDTRKLTEKDKEHMFVMCKSAPESFRGMFPVVPAGQRHLLRAVTPPERRTTPFEVDAAGQPLTFSGLTARLMSEKKLGYLDAQNEAQRIMGRSFDTNVSQ